MSPIDILIKLIMSMAGIFAMLRLIDGKGISCSRKTPRLTITIPTMKGKTLSYRIVSMQYDNIFPKEIENLMLNPLSRPEIGQE
jgi:hypothetical protein